LIFCGPVPYSGTGWIPAAVTAQGSGDREPSAVDSDY
jgi:hypothetical protein